MSLATVAKTHRVVVVGGGFGGLHATQCLKNVPVTVTLIDRRNFHLFQPLLYQVATGWLSPANIAATLRAILQAPQEHSCVSGRGDRYRCR
jgi:NADH dehydrogenase